MNTNGSIIAFMSVIGFYRLASVALLSESFLRLAAGREKNGVVVCSPYRLPTGCKIEDFLMICSAQCF